MLPREEISTYLPPPNQSERLWAKNRIKYASIQTNLNYSDGFISEKEIGHIGAHAWGGFGLVTY